MRKVPMHRFVARKTAVSYSSGRAVVLLPVLIAAAVAAPSALAIDLGVKAGGGAVVQAGPVNAGVSTATDARVGTGAARNLVGDTRDTGARGAREVDGQVSGAARTARDAGIGAARRAGQDVSAAGAASTPARSTGDRNANGVQARADARIDAQGSLQANDRAKAAVDTHAAAAANSVIGAAPTPPEESDR